MSIRFARTNRALLLAGSALLAVPAMAQDAPPPADAPATDQATAADENEIGEVVVTARRRNEALLDVPIAVTSFSGEQLERQGAVDITDVGDTTPNVTLEVSRGTNSTLTAFIRGIGQQDPVAGFEQGVGIYLDDVYLNRPQGSVLDIYDVERIEVLRGPQGTLYGRNTIGGAIKYVTRRLSDKPELRLRGTVGTYGQLDGVATASYPIADMFRLGASVARLTRDGFGTNYTTGEDNYDKDVLAGRISAEIGSDDSALLRLSADYTRDKSNARGGHRLIPSLCAATCGQPFFPVDDDVFNSSGGQTDPEQKVTNKGFAAHGKIEVADGLTLKSITAFRKDKSLTPIDFDALPAVDLDVPGIYKNKQFSQEAQLEVDKGPLAGVVGAYYLKADAQTIFDVRLFTTFNGFTAFTDADVHTKTWAIFGDFTYDISEQFAVSAGARYTNDKRHTTVFRQSYLGGGSTIFGGLGIPFGAATSDFEGRRTDKAFTPRVSISFKPNDGHHFYASWSKGFKGGGFDPRGQSTQAPDLDGDGVDSADIYDYMAFEPEKVTSYELGWKASLFDKRVFTSLALFHAKYTDMQIPASVPCLVSGFASFCGLTSNAGKARIQGVEFEGNARLFGNPGGPRMNFAWSLGYLNADFKEFLTLLNVDEDLNPFPGNAIREVDVAKFRKIQNTPEWTASGTLSYTTPLYDGRLDINSTLSYRSKSQQFEIASPGLDQKGFALLDASIVYELPHGHWTVGLHGKNLTNKKYVSAGYNFLNVNPYTGEYINNGAVAGATGGVPGLESALGREGVLTAYYGNPRQIMFTLGYKL
jgi:iron complex outermembrane receptor protein